MPVKRHPGLKPERIARAKPDRRHRRIGQQCLRKLDRPRRGHGNLIAVLAGIAGARDPDLRPVPVKDRHIHEFHRRHFGDQCRQHPHGLRPLQRQKRAIRHRLDGHARQPLQQRDILIGAGGIDDQKQVIAAIGDHQIVQNPARIIGEQPVTLPPFRQTCDIRRHRGFQHQSRILGLARGRAQDHLPHMAHVEQPGLIAGVQMLAHHPHRVLHRHFPAGEGHHLAPQ